MLQRLQTVYLTAIIIIAATLCTGSVVKVQETVNGVTNDYSLNMFYYTSVQNGEVKSEIQIGLIALIAIIIGITLFVIFSFKDRKKQLKFAKVNYIFMILLVLVVLLKAISIPSFAFGNLFPYSLVGMLLMAFLFYLNWRAIRLIRKDEKLVTDADRLR
ncbi:MAG: DUF4293 family protein [Bacteroidia bacterium]